MTMSLPLRWQVFRLGKRGNAAEDYEDAAAGNVSTRRFAVADGASEASFAAVWARLLVGKFVADPGQPWIKLDWVAPAPDLGCRGRWTPTALVRRGEARPGAFATFLGLSFRPRVEGPGGWWRAVAIGDCGLFHTRDEQLLRAFPLTALGGIRQPAASALFPAGPG